jgi:hypothetical protein
MADGLLRSTTHDSSEAKQNLPDTQNNHNSKMRETLNDTTSHSGLAGLD